MGASPHTISGRIIFKKSVPAFSNATITITLEDVSYADRKALIVSEKVIPHVHHNLDKTSLSDTLIKFTLPFNLEKIFSKNDYGVRACIKILNEVTYTSKSIYSDQYYPVLTNGYNHNVDIVFY